MWYSKVVAMRTCFGLGCVADAPPSFLLFHDARATEIDIPEIVDDGTTSWTAEPAIALDDVGRIQRIRALGGGMLGIVDPLSCQALVKRLDAAGEIAPIARYGRCGEGPGEFRDITDVALDGDTVIVADYQRNVLTFFVASGDGHRTLRIERTADDPWNITDILSANEQEVLLNGSLSGTACLVFTAARPPARTIPSVAGRTPHCRG